MARTIALSPAPLFLPRLLRLLLLLLLTLVPPARGDPGLPSLRDRVGLAPHLPGPSASRRAGPSLAAHAGMLTGPPPRPSLAAATGRTRGTTMFAPRTQFMWASAAAGLALTAAAAWGGPRGHAAEALPPLAATPRIQVDPPDVVDEMPSAPAEESTSPLWRLVDRWHTQLPALRPAYEDKLYLRQRRLNPDVEPGPYAWVRLRHVFAGALLFIAASALANGLLFLLLSRIHSTFPLAVVHQAQLKSSVQKAMNLVRYEQIMFQGAGASHDDLMVRAWELMADYEATEQRRLIQVLSNRFGDALTLLGTLAFGFYHQVDVRYLWGQIRLLFRLNFRTPFRALWLLFISDVFLGFHSNELWVLFLGNLGERYGLKVAGGHWINIVKGIVPVCVDVLFKFIIFFKMQRKTSIIMREMNDL